MLGRYKINEKLANGATGALYLAEDPERGTVAIKLFQLRRNFAKPVDAETASTRILEISHALTSLRHPNVVEVYEAGRNEGDVYVVMEYLRGRDLSHFIEEKSLGLEEIFRIVVGVADGLGHAHAQGIVHRDVKPANIVYNRDCGEVKVTDFGLSTVAGSAKRSPKVFAGTPYYMAPEQVQGKGLDARADVYALGVTLFQLVTGRLPFQANSLDLLVPKIEREAPPDVLAFRPELAQSGVCLRAIMDNVLQKRPQDRYQSCADFIEDLAPCADVIVNTLS